VEFKTADLCDRFAAELEVCEPLFRDYGGKASFAGPIATLKCFEDNSRVREATAEAGHGRVLVVDAGGSMRRAVLGDMLAQQALDNGWSGLLIYGCVRDTAVLAGLQLGVKALGACPLKTDKRGEGQRDLPVRFAGVNFRQGQWLYADEDGVVLAPRELR
jgi:regulator of ribonuclease activity A